jgi:hypothetical protein
VLSIISWIQSAALPATFPLFVYWVISFLLLSYENDKGELPWFLSHLNRKTVLSIISWIQSAALPATLPLFVYWVTFLLFLSYKNDKAERGGTGTRDGSGGGSRKGGRKDMEKEAECRKWRKWGRKKVEEVKMEAKDKMNKEAEEEVKMEAG